MKKVLMLLVMLASLITSCHKERTYQCDSTTTIFHDGSPQVDIYKTNFSFTGTKDELSERTKTVTKRFTTATQLTTTSCK